ncbi:hypothetical protein M407DRAFT_232296 [Tulasnella calospora MUT 4182]|nr:hypothetical protein M407DRAFT_232296 [Tulasnella calospora MUT 4182]
MMIADEDDGQSRSQHPYWYAKVLGVFHCNVRHRSTGQDDYERMDVLWIRWLGVDPDQRVGGRSRRLNRVGYVPDSDGPGAFGFIDPADVIRGCHLIPSFNEGTRDDLLTGASSVYDLDGEDYRYFSIMRFVDRDMAMRYRGGGIGHMNHGVQQDSQRPQVNDSDSGSEREQDDTSDEEFSSNNRSSDSESNTSESGDSDLELDAD